MRALRDGGVTIILTTHYIDEAEEMADRIGVINKGEIILVEDKAELMRKLGKKQLTLQLQHPLDAVPAGARRLPPRAVRRRRNELDLHLRRARRARRASRRCCDDARPTRASASRTCSTTQSSLEDIFVSLVREEP